LVPHTNGPRDVPLCGALSLLAKPLHIIVLLRPLFAAALVVRRRYLIVVPRPMPAAPPMYLIVVYRPLPAAPLVVRCMYMVVVPRPMPAAVASICCRRRFQQLAARGAKTNACGRSFAVLATQVLSVGLRLQHNRPTCGSKLEVSCDAFEAVKETLVSCAAEQSKYCSICTVTLGPCGDSFFTSWGCWQCFPGGADADLKSYYAA